MSKKSLKFNCQNQIAQNKWAWFERIQRACLRKGWFISISFMFFVRFLSQNLSIRKAYESEYRFKHEFTCCRHPVRFHLATRKTLCFVLRNLVLTFKFQTLLAHLCVALSYCIRCQKKEEKLNFTLMHLIFHELFAFTRKQ